ncbi:MAG: GNAT family N-acetyltransferase [Alphaproteobacteria bacterium]|nr:GNAT family N-acetyltransferase [Alphaproteobacteria bacterium]
MTTKNLKPLFCPSSVAVIGASTRPKAVGSVLMRNLLQGGFAGPIMPVNPKHRAVGGVLAYPDIASLPVTPDMAVICTPPEAVPAAMTALGERGTKAAILITAGLNRVRDASGRTLQEVVLEIAHRYEIRILGPNCLGLLVPGIGLNASFAHQPALPGKIAFVSQSGAMCTVVLDWARPKGIGFSHFISLGDSADLDFGDVMDYLGSDPSTRAILLYIESIHLRRNFMSAARSAARNKPVLAIKAGRMAEGAKAAASHTGALAGSDDVYDAAIRRSGMLRVNSFEELFAAVETLARGRPLRGSRLAILTNGGGIGVMAVDHLVYDGGRIANLSADTIAKLDKVLPDTWSRANPVDIIGDAPGERYVDALKILFEAPEVDAVCCMHAPTAISSSTEVAEKIIPLVKADPSANLLTCWVGEEAVAEARRLFAAAGIPSYDTPDKAMRAFIHLVEYRRNQELLMETPPSAPSEFTPAVSVARLVVENSRASGHEMMNEPEAKAVLAAFGIPTIETHIARTPADASRLATEMGGKIALKILSQDISHKSDVGGVILDLDGPLAVEKAAVGMLARVKQVNPAAVINGFTVQRMARRPGAHELIIGVTTDPIFGPVILFGQGGTAVEVIADRAMALPPLNMVLARELISRTRIFKLLRGYRDRPPVNLDALCLTLMQVSQMVIDIPEIAELDINPLFADSQGVLALDARIKLASPCGPGADRLAIRPYPKELEESYVLADGSSVLLRPIRPEDEPSHRQFLSSLDPEDFRYRFFSQFQELPHSELARFTQIDYDREMAFIAVTADSAGNSDTVGVVRTITDPENNEADFAIVIRSNLKGRGIGRVLLDKMIRYCRSRNTKSITGHVLVENTRMLAMIESFGFKRDNRIEDNAVRVCLQLR